ncbi:MAG TPA: hypothetical protein VKB78_12115 [Pirellulales bacterium]|nr:hypothetical protein [Pirellulales bacterium]
MSASGYPRKWVGGCLLIVTILSQSWLAADGPANQGKKRVLPPKWDQRTLDKFFSDARSTLEGERPNFNNAASSPSKTNSPDKSTGPSAPDNTAAAGDFAWSKIVSPESLQDEIKSYQNLVKDDVKNPSAFKGEGFKRARRNFSMLAVAFAVIAEYDGDVRWKNQALVARDLFAKAGFNCKVATDQSFNDAKGRADDLIGLVRGETLPATGNPEAKTQWAKVANRPPLMNRLELAQQNRIAVWTANAGDFTKNLEAIYREAQIVAVLAEVIQREGYDFTDDNSYKGFARDLEKHALEVAEAAKSKNFDQARLAAGELAKACSNCHGSFRN